MLRAVAWYLASSSQCI